MKMIINFEGIFIKYVYVLFIILKKKQVDLNNNDNSLYIFVEYVVFFFDNEIFVWVLINMEFFLR